MTNQGPVKSETQSLKPFVGWPHAVLIFCLVTSWIDDHCALNEWIHSCMKGGIGGLQYTSPFLPECPIPYYHIYQAFI